MKPNGTEQLVLRPVPMERSSKTVFASAPLVNSKKAESATTSQLARTEPHGTENRVLEFHVFQVPHTTADAVVVKLQSTLAQQVPIGMETDAFTSPTSAPQV